jgi:hypothetical protein
MRNLSDESKSSFAAMAVVGSPAPVRIPLQVGIGFYQVVFSHPSMIRYLVLGLKSPSGPARIATRETIKNMLRYGAAAPEYGRFEEPPPEQPQ